MRSFLLILVLLLSVSCSNTSIDGKYKCTSKNMDKIEYLKIYHNTWDATNHGKWASKKFKNAQLIFLQRPKTMLYDGYKNEVNKSKKLFTLQLNPNGTFSLLSQQDNVTCTKILNKEQE